MFTGLPLSLCDGVDVKVIFMSNPTAVLRLRLCYVVVGVVTKNEDELKMEDDPKNYLN